MTQPPGMSPEEFRAQLDAAVGDFTVAAPPIDQLHGRAVRRRRGLLASAATGSVAAVAAVTLLVGNALGATSAADTQSIQHGPGPVGSGFVIYTNVPTPRLSPTPQSAPPPITGPTARPSSGTGPTPTGSGTPICSVLESKQYLQADSASIAGGVVTIVGHVGYLRCNNALPEQVEYRHHQATASFTLSATAVFRQLNDNPVLGVKRAPLSMLPHFINTKNNHTSGFLGLMFFRYRGSRDNITALTQLYHP